MLTPDRLSPQALVLGLEQCEHPVRSVCRFMYTSQQDPRMHWPGQRVAQTGPAAADHALVAHESAVAVGETGAPAGEAWAVLPTPPAEGHLRRRLLREMLRRIWALPVPGG